MRRLIARFFRARKLTKALVLAGLLAAGWSAPQALIVAGLVSDGAGDLAQ